MEKGKGGTELASSCQLKSLAQDSEEFLSKAAKKLSRRSPLQQMDFLNVRKMWSSNRKVDQIYESLWPKLLRAEEDAKQIQMTMDAKKQNALSTVSTVSEIMVEHITGHESRINQLDDLSNDCREVLYEAKKEFCRLMMAMQFNCVSGIDVQFYPKFTCLFL
jgi:Mg2+ and Co2+ transporter CorA